MLIPREATEEDARRLAPRLREADRQEAVAAGAETPLEALLQGIAFSRPPMVAVDDAARPVLMWGVCPGTDPFLGSVWMMASDDLRKHRMAFLRQSREFLRRAHQIAPVLFNYVDERNTVHIEWLRWLGFTFINRHPSYGPEGRPFIEFLRFDPCATLYH